MRVSILLYDELRVLFAFLWDVLIVELDENMAVRDEHALVNHVLLLKSNEVHLAVAWRWLDDETVLFLVLFLANSDHVGRLLQPLNRAFLIDRLVELVLL